MVKILSGPCLALSRSGVPESKYTFTETPHNSLLQSFRSISSDLILIIIVLIIITYNTSEVLSLQIESFVIFKFDTWIFFNNAPIPSPHG